MHRIKKDGTSGSAALTKVLFFFFLFFFLPSIVSGYTQEEKVEIAHRHLIPNQLEQHGLTPQQLHIPQDTTQDIISRYTHTHVNKHTGKTKITKFLLNLATEVDSLFVFAVFVLFLIFCRN